MISKDNLLRKIESVSGLKKELIPLLDRHISSAISFSGLDKNNQNKIVEKLKLMAIEQQRHQELLNGITDSIRRSSSNAY